MKKPIIVLGAILLLALTASALTNSLGIGVFGLDAQGAKDFNVQWTRRPNLRWRIIEPVKGGFKWSRLDAELNQPLQRVLTFRFDAPWAKKCLNERASCAPKNEKDLKDFVSAVVRRYAGRGFYWQIENEPYAVPQVRRFWDDTIDNLIRVIKIAAKEIRRADPSAKIVLAGIPTGPGAAPISQMRALQFMEKNIVRVMQETREDFDIVDIHLYGATESVTEKIAFVKEIMERTGNAHKPIISTENSIYFRPTPTPQEQAQDIPKRMSLTFANGVSLVLYFIYKDNPVDVGTQVLGLLDAQGNPKPAYYSFKQFVERTRGFSRVSQEPAPRGVSVYAFFTSKGKIYVAWAKNSSNFDLSSLIVSSKVTVETVATSKEGGQKESVFTTKVPLSSNPVFLLSNE